MISCRAAFNTYLLLFALLAAGCQTSGEKKTPKDVSTLELFLEATPDGSDRFQIARVPRDNPAQIVVQKTPILTEANVSAVTVVDSDGGFFLKVQFDRRGVWLLENFTASNVGRRLAIACQFGQGRRLNSRWLAAPVINRRIGDGVLTFTPDADRDEAERIAHGLNTLAAKIRKKEL
jgi:preprotein translocase subunit SecD